MVKTARNALYGKKGGRISLNGKLTLQALKCHTAVLVFAGWELEAVAWQQSPTTLSLRPFATETNKHRVRNFRYDFLLT